MNLRHVLKTIFGYLWRLPLCAAAYVGGITASAALLRMGGLPLPELPEQAEEQALALPGAAEIILVQ